MNEKQRQMLGYISQHNLTPQQQAMFLENFDASQEDKQFVIDDIKSRETARVERQRADQIRQAEVERDNRQVKINTALEDLAQSRKDFERAEDAMDNTGLLLRIAQGQNAWLSQVSPQRKYELAVASQADAVGRLHEEFYASGNQTLSDYISTPGSSALRQVGQRLRSSSQGAIMDVFGYAARNAPDFLKDVVKAEQKVKGDYRTGVQMMEEVSAGKAYDSFVDNLRNLDFSEALGDVGDMAIATANMGATEAPYLAAMFLGGPQASFGLRFTQHYAEVEFDPNLTEQQKHAYSIAAGAVDTVGDAILGRSFSGIGAIGGALSKAAGRKIKSKIASKIYSNALARGATRTAGVLYTEGKTEEMQERALIGLEESILGRDISEADKNARIHESFIGGMLFGGSMNAGMSLAGKVRPQDMAKRPADPSFEQGQQIDEELARILREAENVDLGSQKGQALSAEFDALLKQEKQRVGKARTYYSKMRRRAPKTYERILELDSLIANRIAMAKQYETDWAKTHLKGEIETMIEERSKLYDGFDAQSKAPMSLTEQFQDAIANIDMAIADIQEDLDAVEGMAIEHQDDLVTLHGLRTHQSSLRNKKRAMQKALGDIQAAEEAGDVEAMAEAQQTLDNLVNEPLPKFEGTVEQASDDVTQDQAEAQAEETTPQEEATTEEAEQQQAETEETEAGTEAQPETKEEAPRSRAMRFSRGSNVTDSDVANVPTHLIKPIRNFLNAMRSGVEIVLHDNVDGLRAERKRRTGQDSQARAFYDPDTKQIHIHKGTTKAILRHEMMHHMFDNLMSGKAFRENVLSSIENAVGSKKFAEYQATVDRRYPDVNEIVKGRETLALFVEEFGTKDGLNRLRKQTEGKRDPIQRIKDIFNDFASKKYGRFAEQYTITSDTDLLGMMEALVAAQEVGAEVKIQQQEEADQVKSKVMSDSMPSRAYPDLKNKRVQFTVNYPTRFGGIHSVRRDLVFKDYWHFRNFWAQQTGNGKRNWIASARYIGDDGKVKNINMPNPKVDRDGNVIDMEPKLIAGYQREIASQLGYQKASFEIGAELNSLRRRKAMLENDLQTEMSQAELDRMAALNEALRELNTLKANKVHQEARYQEIAERVKAKRKSVLEGNMEDTALDKGAVAEHLKTMNPDPAADVNDVASENQIMDSVDDTADMGVELKWGDGVFTVSSMKDHEGRWFIAVQYDKTEDSSGVGTEAGPNGVTSHATRKQADDMVVLLKKAIKQEAARIEEKEGENLDGQERDVTVLVAFGLQADSILSNPRAIDFVQDGFNVMGDRLFATFSKAFERKALEIYRSEAKKDKPSQAFRALNAAIKTMANKSVGYTEVADELGIPTIAVEDKNGLDLGLPKFSQMTKEQFVQFFEAMKVSGEGEYDDGSIRNNAVLLGELFGSASDMDYTFFTKKDIVEALEKQEFTDVRTSHIVGYREVNARVRFREGQSPLILTKFKVNVAKGKAFKFTIQSDESADFFGLTRSMPFGMLVKDTAVAGGLTFDELKEVEAAEKKARGPKIDELREAKSKQIQDIEKEILDLKVQAQRGEISNRSANEKIKRREDKQEKIAKEFDKKIKAEKTAINKPKQQRIGSAQQAQTGTVPRISNSVGEIDVNSDVTESTGDISDSIDTTWSPRTRGAAQMKFDWVRQKFADKFAPIMMMQEDIEKTRGARVEGDQNFKRAEELMYGKAHYDLEKLETKVTALKDAMVKAGVNVDKVNDFMYARHATERNAMLKSRDGVENGSGITDKEATEVLASFSKEETQALEKLADMVDEISQDTRDTMREFGLESDARIDTFEKMFKNYVPLGGFAQDSQDVDNYPYPTGGVGFHVKGSTTKKAKGRRTPPANIVAQVIQQNAAVKIKARRNEALQSLFNLVKSNPNSKLWNTSDSIPVTDMDRAVGVRVDGEQKFIIFKDASLASNLKGMGVQKMDALSRLMAAPANFLRAAFTTRNPEFIISNFSRDITSALFNAAAEADIPDGAILNKREVAMAIIRRTPQTLKALLKEVAGKDLDPVLAKYLTEFKEDGGQTGWGFVKPLQDIAADLQNETNEGNKAKKAIKWMEKNSLQHIENVNDAFENSIRLSAYIEAREAGVSREDAAQLAKNITVNFNKSGEYGAVANAYYLFFNASIQGTARIVRSLGKMKQVENPDGTISKQLSGPQRMVIGLGLASGMLAMINMALSDEDEDGELFYNKIPDYEKERNLIMMYDGRNYIKIPLPYGYNLFSNFGTAMAETMAGHRDADEAMWFVANSAFSSFSPISFGQSENFAKYIAKGAAPTVLKPLVEMAVNETYFGSKVHQTQFPVGAKRPESELAFRSPKVIKGMFQWLNEATGGSQMVSGSVDINPDLFWYPFEYYIGGLGQFTMRAATSAYSIEEMIRTGEKPVLSANDIPFLRKVYGEPSKYYDFDLYDNNKGEIMQLYKEYKNDRSSDPSRYIGVVKLDKKIKKVEKQLKSLRQQRRAAQDLPYVERVNRSAELQEKERILIMQYNALHDELRN